jgi:hypothetical protein
MTKLIINPARGRPYATVGQSPLSLNLHKKNFERGKCYVTISARGFGNEEEARDVEKHSWVLMVER